ncbi:MAG: PDZ domain-containing protein [Planctomycetales bacterium]
MKTGILCLTRFSILLLGLMVGGSENRAAGADEPLDLAEERAYQQAAGAVAPSVVRVETVGGLDRVDKAITGTAATTGLVVGADGWIITSSFNFSGQPSSILVSLPDGKKLAAKVAASDRQKMLTLLKVDAKDLPVPTAAPEKTWRVGQTAIALGATYDSSPAISVGIVSALNRIWGKAVQTDAKISPVNYGGPLVDLQGRVLGVLVPLSPNGSEIMAGSEWYDSGIGFCVPLAQIQPTLPRLQKGENLVPGRAGITLNIKLLDQAVVDRVDLGSPARKAGLKTGDKIIAIDGQKVAREAQIRQIFGRKYAGDTLKVTYERDQKQHETELTLVAEFPPFRAPFLGLLLQRSVVPDPKLGLEIFDVLPDSPAAKAGIKAGDRLMSIDGREYDQPRFVREYLIFKQPTEPVKVVTSRGGKTETREIVLGDAHAMAIYHPAVRKRPALPPKDQDPMAKSGLIHAHSEEDKRDYWAYLPAGLTEAEDPSLVVWLHPRGKPMEKELVEAWKQPCEERRIILVAPLLEKDREWGPQDLEFVSELIQTILLETVPVNRSRISFHGEGSGAAMAMLMAERFPELAQGICLINPNRRSAILPHDPERPYQFLLIGTEGKTDDPCTKLEKQLREMMYPVIRRNMPSSSEYPSGELIKEIVAWVDTLDRI